MVVFEAVMFAWSWVDFCFGCQAEPFIDSIFFPRRNS